MRYLKDYKSYNEEADFDPQAADTPDVKMSKEELVAIMNQIKLFKSKKSQIDQIYLSAKDDNDLQTKINQVVGPQISTKEDRNPFMVEYLTVSNLKRKIDKIKKDVVEDKIKLDDFGEDLKDATEGDVKTDLNQKISDITKRINMSNTSISKLTNEITAAEKSLNTKMDKQEKSMKDYIKNITDKK
jgi:predicted  nucleic acid-binding Zn-ribbon protein